MMNEIDLVEELDDKTKLLFKKMQKELKSKDAEINELKKQLDFLKNQVLNKNRKLFGKSSERADENQLSFFNEAEKNSDSKAVEPKLEEVVYTRKKTLINNLNINGYCSRLVIKINQDYLLPLSELQSTVN